MELNNSTLLPHVHNPKTWKWCNSKKLVWIVSNIFLNKQSWLHFHFSVLHWNRNCCVFSIFYFLMCIYTTKLIIRGCAWGQELSFILVKKSILVQSLLNSNTVSFWGITGLYTSQHLIIYSFKKKRYSSPIYFAVLSG